jgi:signal-transduction protein with cAMP-binding, CBS, and nucleotidyltransferase domain
MRTAEELLIAKGHKLLSVTPDVTIYDALMVMNRHGIGSIVISEGDKIVGIWTERDQISDVMQEGFDPKKAIISEHMTRELKYSEHDETVYQLQDKFLGMRLRHLLISKNGKFIGILSEGDVMRALLNEAEAENKSLNKMVSWDYYENWRWDQNK